MEDTSHPPPGLAAMPANGDMCAADVDSISQATERRRVQELLRYFKPTGEEMNLTKRPQVSHDTSLNAFAQLAAFKLNCERSFISLMDHKHQYIIAECTRSMSLESGDVYEGDCDALLTGATTLDLEWGVCASTISVFNSLDGSLNSVAQYVKADKDYYIMNDMSQLEEYKSRPYVANWPYMKYYLEVPIHSPSGLAIGTICVVTNESREGVDFKAIATLQEIASTVMDHLDLVTSRVQRRRAEKMINGLGQFADGDDAQRWTKRSLTTEAMEDMRELTIQAQEGSVVLLGSSADDDSATDQTDAAGQRSGYFDVRTAKTPENSMASAESPYRVESAATSRQALEMSQVPPPYIGNPTKPCSTEKAEILAGEDVPPGDSGASSGQEAQGLSTDIDGTLGRAASLVREAVELDGLVFFDVRQAAPVQNANEWFHTTSSNIKSLGDSSSTQLPRESSDILPNPEVSVPDAPFCRVLSSSIAEGTSAHPTQLPESLLRYLRDSFPRGGTLQFDHSGKFEGGDKLEELFGHLSRESQEAQGLEFNSSRLSLTKDDEFLQDIHKLPDIFSNAKKILLFPLTSSGNNHRLFAYAVGFTTDATRVFQREDFAYITSFSNLLMVELARIDIADADLAKSRFISSISHELRSPLHGILASAELLKDAITDLSCLDVIETIETCGSTLLDTLENLLTFAKINRFNEAKEGKPGAGLPPTTPGVEESTPRMSSDVDMCALVEEAMNASIAGHHFNASSMREDFSGSSSHASIGAYPVTVICHISSELNWTYNTQAGAWKRILLNLFGNALKYTSEGHIIVRLLQKAVGPSNSESRQMEVSLIVEDTGRGISKKYLDHDLFKPFRQENSLQPGTGLGLSIVRQLVASMNGSIDVSSGVGVGTSVVVKVLLPISESQLKRAPTFSADLSGLKVGLLGIDALPDLKEVPTGVLSRKAKLSLALVSMLETAIKALGSRILTVASIDSDDADILIATEHYYHSLDAVTLRARKAPLVLLSADLSLDYRQLANKGGLIVHVSQPFGPRRISRALKSCVRYRHESTATEWTKKADNDPLTTLDRPSSPVLPDLQWPAELTLTAAPESNGVCWPSWNVRPSEPRNSSIPAQNGRPRVLLVEDNAINLRILVTYIKKLNCLYETATDGQKALESYITSNGRFDIIFTDIQMPHKDGLTASLEIRQFEQRARLKRTLIVAITGLASAEADKKASISGIDLLLTKPVPMRLVKKIIDERFPAKPAT